MALRTPKLDDRSFDELLEDARGTVLHHCPEWKLTPGDPGSVLIEAFAHLTEVLLYRLNQVPQKAYIELLNLLGAKMQPPSAASVELTFSRPAPKDQVDEIPRGTRVTVNRPTGSEQPPVFQTAQTCRIEKGQSQIKAIAYSAELVEAELLGHGTGQAGLSLKVKRPPIVMPTAEDLRLVVAVEAEPGKVSERVPSISYQGKTYRIWTEVENFSSPDQDKTGYIVDRVTGTITFAPRLQMMSNSGALEDQPRAMAAIPENGREIRAWYWRGGGSNGNVAAGTLTVLKTSIGTVSVTNQEAATGGRAEETLENFKLRGPQEFRSLERAVTADDFEALAQRHGAVARAKAFTRSRIWVHAVPGTVEVLLVPTIPSERLSQPLDSAAVSEFHTESAREQIHDLLDSRRPLGTVCLVDWAKCKTVRVNAKVVAYKEEDLSTLRDRILKRLYQRVNPARWAFGQTLRASHVYDVLLSEPGVNYVENLSFEVDDVPQGDVPCVISNPFQEKTWHAVAGELVFRSSNNGDSWERTGKFTGETTRFVVAHPKKPGLLAAVTVLPGDGQSTAVYISEDAGESWSAPVSLGFIVNGAAWTLREGVPVLFLATNVGLYEVALQGSRAALQILVDVPNPTHGFSSVAVISDAQGGTRVAVASQQNGGVFFSADSGKSETFKPIELEGENIRALTVQYDGPLVYLWASFAAAGSAPGKGAARIQIIGAEVSPEKWKRYSNEWKGGSCTQLAFHDSKVFAGSHQSGVLTLDLSDVDPAWVAPDIDCGLPQRGVEKIFQPVRSVAFNPGSGVLMCSGTAGVYRDPAGKSKYQSVSSPTHAEGVPIPETWLLCSGEHKLEVTSDEKH